MKQDITNTADQDVKTAARLLCARLAKDGHKVSQALALESIAASFGLANWRTLKAKLANPPVSKPVFEGPRYSVDAIYCDNDQMYGDLVDAACPLEAAIYVQLERLTDAGWITRVSVTSVEDKVTGKEVLSASFLGDLDLVPMHEALSRVCALAELSLGEPPARGVTEAEAWDQANRCISFWKELATSVRERYLKLELTSEEDRLEALLADTDFEEQYGSGEGCAAEYQDAAGQVHALVPVQALKTVLDLAAQQAKSPGWEKSDPNASGRFHLIQLQQALEMHGTRFNAAVASDLIVAN